MMGLEMIHIVEKVTDQCPDVIVDFDVIEEHRFFGLGFLSVGKYFLVNNGPYAIDYDVPEKYCYLQENAVKIDPFTNLFFNPGPVRSRICRKSTKFDFVIPSILFLTHFLPDGPSISQQNSLSSLMLGGNGIWGDLLSLKKEDITMISDILEKYKIVDEDVTQSYPISEGFIGSSPEIYEKVNDCTGKGIVVIFTKCEGTYSYITKNKIQTSAFTVYGADIFELIAGNRLKITVKLQENESRTVFIY